jgi:hypothetical protein
MYMSYIGFFKKARGETFKYSRNGVGLTRNQQGTIVSYPPNTLRPSYDTWGNFSGIKFGDGDTAIIPSSVNPYWMSDEVPLTILAIGQAPVGVVWFKFGSVEIVGVGGLKLHTIEIPAGAIKDNRVEIFPNGDNIDEDCHFLLTKFYHQVAIDFGTEGAAMNELNTFMIGDWK